MTEHVQNMNFVTEFTVLNASGVVLALMHTTVYYSHTHDCRQLNFPNETSSEFMNHNNIAYLGLQINYCGISV